MSRAMLVLDTEFQRRKAQDWVWAAKNGSRVEFKGPQRSLDQNALMWSLLTEVATQLGWHGKRLTPDDWKLMFLDALKRERKEELRIVPNLDGTGFVNLSTSSSDLSKDEMSELIEIIYRDGAKHGVTFNEPSGVIPPSSDVQGSDVDPSKPLDVAAEVSEPASGGPAPVDEAEAREEPSASSAGDLIKLKREAIDKFIAAIDPTVPSAKDRQGTIIFAKDAWKQTLPTDLEFIKACTDTANKVVKGELQAPAARKYLEGLVV